METFATDSGAAAVCGSGAFGAVERERLLEMHPVLMRDYTVPTAAIREAYEIARERVWMRRTGVVFYAIPRVGKTRCAFAICESLQREFASLYLTHLTLEAAARSARTHLYRMILGVEHHALRARAGPEALERLTAHTALRVQDRGGSQYVLLLDEMQLLGELDYEQLLVLHNRLEHLKVRMTTIGFAQPQILSRRSALQATENRQVIARFLAELVRFEGCSSHDSLRDILDCFDTRSEYPEGSGISYTRFFVPQAFAAGFRLTGTSQALWHALSSAAASLAPDAIPMEHLCLAIHTLLLWLRQRDGAQLSVSDGDIDAVVSATRLSEFGG